MNLQQTSFLSEVISGEPIPLGQRAYFRERFKSNLYELIINLFLEKEDAGEITRAELARRIDKRPEQITRLLGASGNLRLSTVSDLLLGLGCEPDVSALRLADSRRNYIAPEWINAEHYTSHPVLSSEPTKVRSTTPDTAGAYVNGLTAEAATP